MMFRTKIHRFLGKVFKNLILQKMSSFAEAKCAAVVESAIIGVDTTLLDSAA